MTIYVASRNDQQVIDSMVPVIDGRFEKMWDSFCVVMANAVSTCCD